MSTRADYQRGQHAYTRIVTSGERVWTVLLRVAVVDMIPETKMFVSPALACLRYRMLVLETRIQMVLCMNVKHALVHVEAINSSLSSWFLDS